MNTVHKLHDVALRPAFFEGGNHATLLRYLDPDFVNRFRQDVHQKRFSAPQFRDWLEEERHSHHDDTPVLRLPTHRAFHLVCLEVVCQRLGTPALDPQKIASAGFVIRRETSEGQQAWIMEEGEAVGWQSRQAPTADPDLSRRLCRNGILHRRPDQFAFSGEEVHPLHPMTITDDKGKCRTLLFGYVPLGGFYYERNASLSLSDSAEINDLAIVNLPWPFGYANGRNRSWNRRNDTIQVERGEPTKAFTELLTHLVNRYHVGEADRTENADIEALCNDIEFYDPDAWIRMPLLPSSLTAKQQKLRLGVSNPFGASTLNILPVSTGQSITGYLKACFARGGDNPLVKWQADVSNRADRVGGLQNLGSIPKLPQADGSGVLTDSLAITESDAESLRLALGQRLRSLTLATAKEIPLPKFGQDADDRFRIIPFVRSKTDKGGEQITWADSRSQSDLFRVAATFDPEASRPSLIPMPSLRDLKRGLAKGASILTPGDTFSVVNALKFKKGVSEETVQIDNNFGATVQWICSFSLPVITIVAMILLMIMVSLLNIIFFWMPWVRICLPFPKIPKGQ
ncbi:MAG: hypothetical protein VW258_03555 [Thalassolituus sp.]